MSGSARLALVVLAIVSVGWLDRWAGPREAARLYADGKFDDAAAALNQALVDAPDSALLHFNLGDAEYRRKQYEPAARAFSQVPQDPEAEYNLGNVLYRQGQAAEEEKPQDALTRWGEALVAYRRAIVGDPSDEDAKFNYEWVSRQIDELKKKLEQQQDQQKQDQQQQQQNQDQQQQENQDQQQGEQQRDQQQQNEDENQDEQQQRDERQQGQEQQPQDQEPQAQQGQERQQQGEQQEDRQEEGAPQEPQQQAGDEQPQAGGEPQVADGRMTRDEAAALLDGERSEELQPGEVIRRQLGGGDVPAQDW